MFSNTRGSSQHLIAQLGTLFLAAVQIELVAVAVTATNRPQLVAEADEFATDKLFYAVVAVVTDDHFVHVQSILEHIVLLE